MRILVVDDEEPIRTFLLRLLRMHDYGVDMAGDGAEALDRLERQRYDLMLLDRNMPRISGVDVLASVRSSSRFDDLPIIMVTCASFIKEIDEAFISGADGFVIKPFDPGKLLAKVKLTLMTGRIPRPERRQQDEFRALYPPGA